MRAWILPVGGVLTVLTWHVASLVPGVGIDDSWQVALTMAASRGLDFGRDVVFTYGPLGFLSVPTLGVGHAGWIAVLFAVLAQLAVACVVLAAATRLYGRWVGLVAAFVALGLTLVVSDALAYLAFFAAVWLLEREAPPRDLWIPAVAGFAAAFELLVKLNGGIVCLVLFALAVWRVRAWIAELVLAASFVLSFLLLWLVTRNSVGAIPDWLRASRHVVGSYTEAQALQPSGRTAETVLAAVLVVAFAALVVLQVRVLPRARAITLVLAAAFFTYAYLKEGFVRHDLHVLWFFGAFAVAALAFEWRGAFRWGALALVVGAAIASVVTPDASLSSLYVRHLGRAFDTDVAHARAEVRSKLGVPPALVEQLRGRTVDSAPYETSAIWAYGLRWRPEPLLQWYLAYDESLDELNAKAIAEHGAERVLMQQTAGTDAELLAFQAPATYVSLLCHYRELAAIANWEVLARVPNRCSPELLLKSVHVAAGEGVPVPAAPVKSLVIAHVHLGRSFLSTVFKPRSTPKIAIGGNVYRLVPTTAGGPLVLRAPAAAGRSPFFGGFTEYTSFTLSVPATVDFEALPIRPEPFHVAPQTPPPGSLASGSLTVQGHAYRVDPNAYSGWVDTGQEVGAAAALNGWAVDASHKPAPAVAAFEGSKLVGVAVPTESRADVAQAFKTQAALQSGYRFFVRLPHGAPLRVFAFGRGVATELRYPAGYPWGAR